MKTVMIIFFSVSLFSNFCQAQLPADLRNDQFVSRRLTLQQEAAQKVQEENVLPSPHPGMQRSIKKAVLFSLLVPGAGQFYTKSYLKSGFFLATEISAWLVNISYNKKGDDKDTEFKVFADGHWSERQYWSYVAYRASFELDNPPFTLNQLEEKNDGGRLYYLIPDNEYTPETVKELRNIEHTMNDFSHQLPETKTQQYYEMIGKYPAQFGYAWDDASFDKNYSGYTGIYTPRNNFYMDMRNEANHFYNIAGYGSMVALVNHVIAAVDAGFTARRFNRKNAVEVRMSYKNKLYKTEYLNMFGLNVSW